MKRAVILLFAAMCVSSALADEQRQFSKRVPAGAKDHISVSNVAGSVSITTWDRPEVDVQAVLDEGVERVEVIRERGNVEIRVVLPSRPTRRGTAALRITVPATVEVEASTVSASLSVRGPSGKVRLKSVSGGIRADMSGAELEVKSVSGRIDLSGNGVRGKLRASSVSGSVTVRGVAGDLEIRSTSGRLDIGAEAASDVRLESVSGPINYQGSLARDGNLEAESVSGSVRIHASAGGGYRYSLSSYSGSISSCLAEWDPGPDDRKGKRKRMHATFGEGSANVSARSMSGSIYLCGR